MDIGVRPWVYGPFDERNTAERFAGFITAEVRGGFAEVSELRSPTAELNLLATNPEGGSSGNGT